jgi:hypothetical protein
MNAAEKKKLIAEAAVAAADRGKPDVPELTPRREQTPPRISLSDSWGKAVRIRAMYPFVDSTRAQAGMEFSRYVVPWCGEPITLGVVHPGASCTTRRAGDGGQSC